MNTKTIEHYNKFITRTEDMTSNRIRYHSGNNFIIEVTKVNHDLNNKKDLMNIWKARGYIKEVKPTSIAVTTYFTDCNGLTWGMYNITHKGRKIDFDYLFEWNESNIKELVAECIRLREMGIA